MLVLTKNTVAVPACTTKTQNTTGIFHAQIKKIFFFQAKRKKNPSYPNNEPSNQTMATTTKKKLGKLVYWGTRGNAELIRLVLAAAGVSYDEESCGVFKFGPQDDEPFLALRESGELAFDAVPLWIEYSDGEPPLKIVQSRAIVRHLARTQNLYGDTFADNARVDEILDQDADAWFAVFMKAVGTPKGDDEAIAKAKQAMAETDVAKHMGFMERILRKSPGEYSVGNKLTVADVVIWRLVDEYTSNDVLSAETLAVSYPLSKALYEHLPATVPSFKAYVESPDRPPLQRWWGSPLDLPQNGLVGSREWP